MGLSNKVDRRASWLSYFPPAGWLANYQGSWLPQDLVADITLAAYAIPLSLAYAALAGLPPQLASMITCSAALAMPFSALRANSQSDRPRPSP
jgi:MFS superfamily sulfate permease-like transporter